MMRHEAFKFICGAAEKHSGDARFLECLFCYRFAKLDLGRVIGGRCPDIRAIMLRPAPLCTSSEGARTPMAGYDPPLAGARSAVRGSVIGLGFGLSAREPVRAEGCGVCSRMFTSRIDSGTVARADAGFENYARKATSEGRGET